MKRTNLIPMILKQRQDDGYEKYLVIGFDTKGNLIEVMYNVIDENNINVFHAMKCRKEYLKLLER